MPIVSWIPKQWRIEQEIADEITKSAIRKERFRREVAHPEVVTPPPVTPADGGVQLPPKPAPFVQTPTAPTPLQVEATDFLRMGGVSASPQEMQTPFTQTPFTQPVATQPFAPPVTTQPFTQSIAPPSPAPTAIPTPQVSGVPEEVAWWEKPAVVGEKAMEAVGRGVAKVPILEKVIKGVAPIFDFIHENLEKPFASVVSAPWSPDLAWKSGESWLEHEKREYDAWQAPTYVKGLAEFAMPLWWLPWFGWIKTGRAALLGAGKASKMAAILPKLPVEALLPTYTQLNSFIPNNFVKRMALKLENVPVLNKTMEVLGGRQVFARSVPATAAQKARNYGLFLNQHRDMGSNIARLQMNDLMMKRMVTEGGKQLWKNEDDLFKFFDSEMLGIQRVNAKVGSVTIDKTHRGVVVKGKASLFMDDVFQNPNSYKWADKAAHDYVKQGHKTIQWMMDWAKANGVTVPSTKKGLKIVGDIIQEHIPRMAKGVTSPTGKVFSFKRTDPFREMVYETMQEAVEAGVKYGGTFADRVHLMTQSIARRVAQNKFDNAVKPLGKTIQEKLEKAFPELVDEIGLQTGRVVALKKSLASLERRKPIQWQVLDTIEREFPELAREWKSLTAIDAKVAKEYINALSKSSRLIILKDRKPLIEELLSNVRNNFYDTITIVNKHTRSEAHAVKLAGDWYKKQLGVRAKEYNRLVKQVKKEVIPNEEARLKPLKKTLAQERRKLPKPEKLEARFTNHPAFNQRIFEVGVVRELEPILGKQGVNWIRHASEISGLSRMAVAALDLSAPFIQGLAVFGRNPLVWGKSVGKMLGIAARPQQLYIEIAARKGAILERILAGGSTAGIDIFEAMPVMRNLAKRVPKVGGVLERGVIGTYGRAEVAFLGFSEIARDEMWKVGKFLIGKKGLEKAAASSQLRELARSLDRMTGIISPQALGIPLTQQQMESAWIFFSPRYTRAGLSFIGDMFASGLTGAEARKALGGVVLGGLTMYKAATTALGQEMHLDPRSSKFMTIKVGETYFGIGGIYYAVMRMIANVTATAFGDDPGKLSPLNFSRVDNPFYRFMYSRTAPLTGLTFGLAIEQKDYHGEPFENFGDYAAFIADKVLPIAVQSQMPWEREPWQDSAFQPMTFGAEFTGLRIFPENSWEARQRYRDNLAGDRFQRPWNSLNRVEQREIEADYPILDKFDEEISEWQQRRGLFKDVLFNRWEDEIDQAKKQRDDAINIASKLANQDGDLYQFRLRVRSIESGYAAAMSHISSNEEYASLMEKLEEPKDIEKLSQLHRHEAAYYFWAKTRYSTDETSFGRMQNELGEPIWENIEKLRQWTRDQFGEDALQYIEEERPLIGRDLPEEYLELEKAEKVLRPYWSVKDTVIRLFGERFADSPRGKSLITKRRKLLRLSNPEIEKYYQMFYRRLSYKERLLSGYYSRR